MFRPCLLLTVCVIMSMSVCLSRGGAIHNYDDTPRWNYTQEVLATTGNLIYDITVSQHTGHVYVALAFNDTLLVIKRGTSTTEERVTIDDITSVAVDNTEPKIYIGSWWGIQTYDEKSGVVTRFEQIQHYANKLFVPRKSEELYIVEWNGGDVYRYGIKSEKDTKIENIRIYGGWEYRFVVDLGSNFFYTTTENDVGVTKLQLHGHNDTVTYNGGPYSALAVDNTGRVFGSAGTVLYHLKVDGKVDTVATLDFTPRCMSFDGNNNPVLATEDNVIIFKLS